MRVPMYPIFVDFLILFFKVGWGQLFDKFSSQMVISDKYLLQEKVKGQASSFL